MKDLTPPPGTLDWGETLGRSELQAIQLARLRRTLRHVHANVPHYRAAFAAAGVTPDDLRDLSDLRRFPFTVKDDLRRAYPFGLLAVPRDRITRIHASSGTTGKPTVVGYTAEDIDTWADLMARSLRAAGVRPGDLVHCAYGYGLFTGGLGAHYGIERLGATAIPMSGGQTARQVQLIEDFRPTAILVTPSYMLNILEEYHRQGRDPRACPLEVGIFGAEPWTPAMRTEIEDAFDMHAVDIYGLSEVMGPGVAQECVDTKDGLHIWEDHFLPEIIDPETGEVLPDGEEGELVITTLTKVGMPVIRYRTRDLTRLLPGTARPHRRIRKITGRSDDMIILRGVNVFPTQVEELVLGTQGLAPHFQIELLREGALDVMRVHVECLPGAQMKTAKQSLTKGIKDMIGVTCQVIVAPVGGVERSQGKARRVIDNRGQG